METKYRILGVPPLFEVIDNEGNTIGNPYRTAELAQAEADRLNAGEAHKSEAIDLLNTIKAARDALRALAEVRPAITLQDITPDRCNIPDREIRAELERFKSRYNVIDVSDLADEDGNQDPEKWELLAGGSERFAVAEVEDMTSDDAADTVYAVWDTELGQVCNPDTIVDTFDDEDDANADAEERNREDTDEGLCGFPFAHNYGVELEGKWEIEQFAACGWLVYRYNDDKLIAGIDGGGYSFDGAHWAPLLHAKAKAGGWKIETETGPRRVE